MPNRRALILGVTGQLGSYLAELLLHKGYTVYGMVRRVSADRMERIRHLEGRLEILHGDLTDQPSIERALQLSKPQEIYNCAAQSQVGTSFIEPLHSADVPGLGALRLFEAVRTHTSASAHVRIYHASTSEMFGNQPPPQSEATPFNPSSPYACAKTFAHFCAQMYRRAYGMFIACGINFNFESERRSPEFVTRKITQGIARIKAGESSILRLGNLAAIRDWSHAEDVARAAWLMLQQPTPDDYVIASGESHTVQEFVDLAFSHASLNSSDYVHIDPQLFRPLDVGNLQGCAAKAKAVLGWEPTIRFSTLVQRMVEHDLTRAGSPPAHLAGHS